MSAWWHSNLNSQPTSRISFPSSVKLNIYIKIPPQGIAELDIGHLTSIIEGMRPPRRVIYILAEWMPNSSAFLSFYLLCPLEVEIFSGGYITIISKFSPGHHKF